MKQSFSLRRLAPRVNRGFSKSVRLAGPSIGFEVLEERKMLSINDLLVSTFDDTAGASALRYDPQTELRIPGGAPTGAGLSLASGLAVAPDGSYYVASLGGGQVSHFDNSGNPLPALGAGDATPVSFFGPGAMQFGPNGHLYVADLFADAIFQFDTTSGTQQFLPAATISLGFSPGGFTFALDGSNDIIVGDLDHHSVIRVNSVTQAQSTVIGPASNIYAGAILPLANGKLYIADFDHGGEPTLHHRIVLYDPTTPSPSFTTFIDTNATVGAPHGEPLAMLFDTDGNLLVGLSPDHLGNGALEKFDINDKHLITTIASGIGSPSGMAFIAPERSDILSSTFDDTAGQSVLRYTENSHIAVPGGAATSVSLSFASGLAVAPDGSYYVSSLGTGQVLHFDKNGNPLPALGASDTTQAPLIGPRSLAFGPNGHLYVGDLFADTIFQFDTGAAQEYLPADDNAVGYSVGGIGFTTDPTRDLIVGDLDHHAVIRYDSSNTPTTIISAANNIYAGSILPQADGKLLIADFDHGGEPTLHHRIVQYDPSTSSFTTFLDTNATAAPPGEPLALLYDHDGNLLVGVSPNHAGNGVLEDFDIHDKHLISVVASSIGSPSGLAFVPAYESTVSGRSLFYQGSSRYDTTGGARSPLAFSDDNAIATDKSAYLPTGTLATYANLSNYDLGINGVMVDLLGNGDHGSITANDFIFKTGNDNTPNTTWTPVVNPTVSIRLGMTGPANGSGTVGNSDRVELTWSTGAVMQKWLEVIVKANTNTGLAANDVFFFGSEIGNTGVSNTATKATTTGTDTSDTVNHGAGTKNNIAITNLYDFNRDGLVNGSDVSDVVNHGTGAKTGLNFINIGSAGPFAPQGASLAASPAASNADSPDVGIASALAVGSIASPAASSPALATGPVGYLRDANRSSGSVTRVFEQLAVVEPSAALAEGEPISDTLDLDDLALDSVLTQLGL